MHEIEWDENDTPVSTRFGDPYFARSDGRAETRHVFLAGNGLPHRWQDSQSFTIAELGFGTGLNLLETLATWTRERPAGGQLNYVAFERFPISRGDLSRALARWDDLAQSAEILILQWPPPAGWSTILFGDVELRLCVGDANDCLQDWDGRADAWYLDGFSPAKNPELWGEALMRNVARHTKPDGTFATFTVAGWVRRNLAAAGFSVGKMPGFGRKRECLKGMLRPVLDSTAPLNS